MNLDYSLDSFLGGKLIIKQPLKGFRAGLDSVLIASIINLQNKNTSNILELGCGVGVAFLSLATRFKNLNITAVEINKLYSDFALYNIEINKQIIDTNNIQIINQDINKLSLNKNSFDIVFSNPPFYKKDSIKNSIYDLKNQGNIESTANLKDFISKAFELLTNNGTFYIIHHTNRFKDLMDNLETNKFGNINLYPIYSKKNESASRFILSAQKFSKSPPKIHVGITIHNKEGNFTKEAINILQNGKEFLKL
jgi:tRNA1(Val) A37 N6-methylase TrmN6